ncbi:MAG: polyprenyl synthetase family protein [Chitinophagales bacterium]|nr:polyprenyl synthetase family protein [Chitinophagales bacterium]MDW8273144.1 polyprenyl synthetase family protein [Chitinophagales bacterium]
MYKLSEVADIYDSHFKKDVFSFEPVSLYEPINKTMANSGKRIRPLLLLMACDLFGGNIYDALNAAFAVELFHNFTLVHDDIMDEAELRRGRLTVYKEYGLNKAILIGDAMHLHAHRYLLKVPANCFSDVMNVFNKAAIEIIEGQQLDMDFESRNDVTVEEYLKMIEFKTSVLLAAALQMGAIIGGASAAEQEKIYRFGLNLGLAFQIKDDYLDAFGEGEKVGKRIGGDILRNKKTFLWITAWNHADKAQKEMLISMLDEENADKKINTVLDIYNALRVKEKAEQAINEFYNNALESLEQVRVKEEFKEPLHSIARILHERDF